MKRYPLFFLSLSFFLPSCTAEKNPNVLYASIFPIYDFAKRIVKDRMEVVCLTPNGTEPHDFEPKARQVASMTDGKGLLVNGLGLDSWSDSLPRELSEKTYVVTEGIPTQTIDGVLDSHVWLSVENAICEMKNILSVVCSLDPSNQDEYQENYAAAREDFLLLEKEYEEKLAKVDHPYLLVSHAAFGYLCSQYGLTQIYVSGLSPEQEPSPKDMERIIEEVKEYQVSTIFYEELVSPEISKKIAQETGIKTATLNPLETLSQEEMDTKDYLSVMRENLGKIVEALNDD